jgi:hypothetical protein
MVVITKNDMRFREISVLADMMSNKDYTSCRMMYDSEAKMLYVCDGKTLCTLTLDIKDDRFNNVYYKLISKNKDNIVLEPVVNETGKPLDWKRVMPSNYDGTYIPFNIKYEKSKEWSTKDMVSDIVPYMNRKLVSEKAFNISENVIKAMVDILPYQKQILIMASKSHFPIVISMGWLKIATMPIFTRIEIF